MTTFDTWWSYFVRPGEEQQAHQPAGRRVAADDQADARPETGLGPAVAVLGPPTVASDYGLALAGRLERPSAHATPIVATWDPAAERTSATTPGGRGRRGPYAVLGALADRGIAARVAGRALTVALPADPDDAFADVQAIRQCAPASPLVVVVAGPRTANVDRLLDLADGVLVLGDGDAASVASLAVVRLVAAGFVAARASAPSPELLALARRGLPLSTGVRAALDAAYREIP